MGKTHSSNIPPLSTHGESYAFSDYEKAIAFNDYFCTVSSIDDSNIDLPYFEDRTDASLSQIIVSRSEIIDILGSLKINKATGP
ncbi:MAG: hypothetical protein AB2536_09200 [Candidatus Thiodiazotropha endolucinida]